MAAKNLVKLVACFFFLASTNIALGASAQINQTSSEKQLKTVNQQSTDIATKQSITPSPITVTPPPVFKPIRATSKEIAPKSVVNFLKYEVANKRLSAVQMDRVRDQIQKLGRGTVNMDRPGMPNPGGMSGSPLSSESSCTMECCVNGWDCSYDPCQPTIYCYPTDCEDGC